MSRGSSIAVIKLEARYVPPSPKNRYNYITVLKVKEFVDCILVNSEIIIREADNAQLKSSKTFYKMCR